MPQLITRQLIEQAITFESYMDLTCSIVANPTPQGLYQNPKTHRYTRSNLERMNKVLQNVVLEPKLYNLLSTLTENWTWLVLSEPWCGDASWGTPTLYLIASCSNLIDFRILLRDEHPDVMKAYKTLDSDSIPKLICLRTKDLKELGTWGPRPKLLQEMVMRWKNEPNIDYRESVRQLHDWYDKDMSREIQHEMIALIKDWKGVLK